MVCFWTRQNPLSESFIVSLDLCIPIWSARCVLICDERSIENNSMFNYSLPCYLHVFQKLVVHRRDFKELVVIRSIVAGPGQSTVKKCTITCPALLSCIFLRICSFLAVQKTAVIRIFDRSFRSTTSNCFFKKGTVTRHVLFACLFLRSCSFLWE